MPLDGAYFIKDLNPANPVGTIDKVSLLDDIIREVKGCVVNTFPDMDGEVLYSTDELNEMKSNFVREDKQWDFKGNPITGVGEPTDEEDETVVLNKKSSDARYLQVENNLSDIDDMSEAFDNLFKEVDYTSDGMKSLKIVMTNLMYPVGSLYMNVQTDQNPTEYLGVGKWVRFAEGRALIGTGELTIDEVNKKWEAGNTTGAYEIKLKENHIPAHAHNVNVRIHDYALVDGKSWQVPHGDIAGENKRFQSSIGPQTDSFGKGEAFSIMPPSIAVHVWRRTE